MQITFVHIFSFNHIIYLFVQCQGINSICPEQRNLYCFACHWTNYNTQKGYYWVLIYRQLTYNPEGRYCRSKMFQWEPSKGAIAIDICTAFNSAILVLHGTSLSCNWTKLTPFWLSTDDIVFHSCKLLVLFQIHSFYVGYSMYFLLH